MRANRNGPGPDAFDGSPVSGVEFLQTHNASTPDMTLPPAITIDGETFLFGGRPPLAPLILAAFVFFRDRVEPIA